jgi:hypothetical protein
VVDQKGNIISEEELLGKKAKVWTTDDEYYQGKITATTAGTITLKINFDPSALEYVKTQSLIFIKADISKMELEWVDQGNSNVIMLTVIGLVAIFHQYIFPYLGLLFTGGLGIN